MMDDFIITRLCYVNCGLSGDQCECYREQMATIYARLLAGQERLPPDFEAAWSDNVDQLYED